MERLSPDDYAAWDDFVARSELGTIFHTAWWHQAWGFPFEILARRDEAGQIVAGTLLYQTRFLMTQAIRRPPFTPVNGPLWLPSAKTDQLSRYSHFRKEVFEALGSYPRLGLYDFIFRPGVEDMMPFMWNGFDIIMQYTYVIQQAAGFRNLHKNKRRDLNRARREFAERGCVLECDGPFEDVRQLLVTTAAAKDFHSPATTGRLTSWWEAVRAKNAGRTYLLRDRQGQALSATLLIWDNRSAYYLASGMTEEVRRKTCLSLLLIERMIQDAHAQGLDFDFEGSSLRGVEASFRSWGGQMHFMFRVVKIPSPIAYCGWHLHRYLQGHRRRRWITND